MPKLIKNIVTTINKDYETIIYSLKMESSLDSLKVIKITQDLSKASNIKEMDVKNFGIKSKIYNNELIIIDGSDL